MKFHFFKKLAQMSRKNFSPLEFVFLWATWSIPKQQQQKQQQQQQQKKKKKDSDLNELNILFPLRTELNMN
ncbi:hypothetical protein DERF_015776 [Dermatophagoides farinae]|uniref:Uncharacterized protein n=1 Tax=Dermatophagoides farinae TaxID=6954 RepID=A0A922HMR9_DERFA|nr:hypothetical protein DERF_015776 [Dermatophagoides farinae]